MPGMAIEPGQQPVGGHSRTVPAPPRRIAVVHHARDANFVRRARLGIHVLANMWRSAGIEVVFTTPENGVAPEVDIAIDQINLTVLPTEYREYLGRFPVVIGSGHWDMRRSSYSRLLVDRSWPGEVIVKTNYNYNGAPEVRAGVLPRGKHPSFFQPHYDPRNCYLFFPSARDVPDEYWTENYVVERAAFEMIDGDYALRRVFFLGDARYGAMSRSPHKIVKNSGDYESRHRVPDIEVPDPVVALIRERRLGIGSIDFTCPLGHPEILDVNKILGARIPPPYFQRLSTGILGHPASNGPGAAVTGPGT